MAISFPVQFVATQGTSNALTRAYGSAVSAGDTLVAFCLVYHATETCDSVSDDINGSWTKAFGPVDCAAPARLYGFYKLNSAAGTPTVTGHFSNFNHKEIAVSRISGLSGGGAFDQYAANGATSTNPSSGLTGTLGASVCAAVGGHANSGVTATTGSGWTTDANMSNWIKTYFETQVTSTNSPIKADWTASNSHWAAGVMVFKDAGGGDTSISCNLGTASASGYAASIAAATVIACALGTGDASGYQATVQTGSNTTINCALGTASALGYTAGVAVSGTGYLATEEFKNNTGTLLTSQTVNKVWLIDFASSPDFSNVVTNATTGVLDLASVSITPGHSYLVVSADSTGAIVGAQKVLAT